MDNPQIIKIQTEHYTFNVLIKKNYNKDLYYSQYLEVGNPDTHCLSLTINTVEAAEKIGPESIKTAGLSNIEALYECVEGDAEKLFEQYSFGKELLEWVINYIKTNFPHVKYLQLDDISYIPCNRRLDDKLDLLSYNIALYCKTWYELNFSAFILNKNTYDRYKRNIEIYRSPETKAGISWEKFYLKNVTNQYTSEIIKNNEEYYRNMYNDSDTFPAFFRTLSKTIKKEDKCNFFKWWLQNFISSFINITRRWVIQLKQDAGHRTTKRNSKK